MKKFILILFAVLSFHIAGQADTESTRRVVAQFAKSNESVLESYDRLAKRFSLIQNEKDRDRLFLAIEYAAKKHEGQTRKDTARTPYIIHPMGVAEFLWEVGGESSANVLAAALLHDTLEDTDATEEEITELFGDRVCKTVMELTNDSNLDSQENKQRQVDHAPNMSQDAKLVKLSDRIYNISDLAKNPPPSWTKEKIENYYDWAEKLGKALSGTNTAMEEYLWHLIMTHKGE